MKKYTVLEKAIGETPLQCAEKWRATEPELKDAPLAYAGRLDPMASGSLLVLIGEECKRQTHYHNLDKSYTVQILLGVETDTGDVLGIPKSNKANTTTKPSKQAITQALAKLTGEVNFPYPHYSSKTVQGKPLHTWTLEGRLDEINIPTKQSTIYNLKLTDYSSLNTSALYEYITDKIETIPPVTDSRKALGNDFRRPIIRKAWQEWYQAQDPSAEFPLLTINCVVSSGTYMRSLAEVLAKELGTKGLALHIHREQIGHYRQLFGHWGLWTKRFR